MRIATIASAALLTVATAALAQVVRPSVEHKNAPGNGNSAVVAIANNSTAQNAASDPDEAGGNDTGTPGNAKMENATPPQ